MQIDKENNNGSEGIFKLSDIAEKNHFRPYRCKYTLHNYPKQYAKLINYVVKYIKETCEYKDSLTDTDYNHIVEAIVEHKISKLSEVIPYIEGYAAGYNQSCDDRYMMGLLPSK